MVRPDKKTMKTEIKVYGSLCALSIFVINGKMGDKEDFGEQGDESPETAEDYACGDMQFVRVPATQEVLKKYDISEDEYNEIATKLEEELSFGSCGWCV